MKQTIGMVMLAALWLVSTGPATAQQRPQSRPRQAQPHVQPARPLYHRRDTWYEFLLKQFNPDNLDYGYWMEQRRRAFLDASARNPYFQYSLGVTIALLMVTVLYAKQWIDHRRTMWITAEMMADLYNHDQYSRDVAKQAIQKYNDHIDGCNRAIEAAVQGTAMSAVDSGVEALKVELHRASEERDRYLQERDKTRAELEKKSKIITAVRLKLEENQLVDVFGETGVLIDGLKGA